MREFSAVVVVAVIVIIIVSEMFEHISCECWKIERPLAMVSKLNHALSRGDFSTSTDI